MWPTRHTRPLRLLVAVDPTRPSTILAGTETGLFHSDDRGATWELAVGDWFSSVGAIAFDRLHPGRVYVGINGAVWHSLDHGRTWLLTPSPNDEDVPVTALAVDATGRVYAGAGELFRSADRGRRWVSLGFASPAQFDAASLAFDPASSALYSATPEGLYRSRDGGSSFRRIGPAGAPLLPPSRPPGSVRPRREVQKPPRRFYRPAGGPPAPERGRLRLPVRGVELVAFARGTMMPCPPSRSCCAVT